MTLVFDWDGTLHNTLRLYGKAFRIAYQDLVEKGHAPSRYCSDQEMSQYLGMSAPDMWNAFMPELPQEVKNMASDRVGQEMIKLIEQGEAILYDGVPALLDQLRSQGYTMVFLSNCKHAYQEAHRRQFGLDRWFSGYFCCEDYGFRPKEEIFPYITAQFPEPYVVIGDRASDFKVAQVHGLKSIGCAYGFGTEDELRMADFVVSSCGEILNCIMDRCENIPIPVIQVQGYCDVKI